MATHLVQCAWAFYINYMYNVIHRAGWILDTIIYLIPHDTRIAFDTRYSILDTCVASLVCIS